jgi:subtilisin family serine protease
VLKAQQKVWVYFTDKPSVEEQDYSKYLSSRAIERRAAQNIPFHFSDVAVNKSYIQKLKDLGVDVHVTSKWLNASSVWVNSEEQLEQIKSLSFVTKVEGVRAMKMNRAPDFYKQNKTATASFTYGDSKAQIQQLKGDFLHDMNLRGQGMLIAVLDGGFDGVNTLGAFDSLWMNNRILATHDFVDGDTNVFHTGFHGRQVLSVLGAHIANEYVGTAPYADYVLLKSEDQSSETKIEEDNWIAAAEFADSVGADIINSSVGYNEFDGGIGDYVYADMDGRTTVISQGAIFAHRKGMLVVVSMGNEGSSHWKYMLSPADVDSVLSVGGVKADNTYHAGASRGPSSDGRQKPNVSARFNGVYYINGANNPTTGNGTSFSAPLVAGLAACLWQSDRSKSNYEILRLIERSSHQFNNPDNFIGYGVPNFALAHGSISIEEEQLAQHVKVYPNPFQESFHIFTKELELDNYRFELFSVSGQNISVSIRKESSEIIITPDNKLESGFYWLKVSDGQNSFTFKLIH